MKSTRDASKGALENAKQKIIRVGQKKQSNPSLGISKGFFLKMFDLGEKIDNSLSLIELTTFVSLKKINGLFSLAEVPKPNKSRGKIPPIV